MYSLILKNGHTLQVCAIGSTCIALMFGFNFDIHV